MKIPRDGKRRVLRSLAEAPAVALLGPRQIGKTTLARDIAADVPDCLYLDLEQPGDAARLADPATPAWQPPGYAEAVSVLSAVSVPARPKAAASSS